MLAGAYCSALSRLGRITPYPWIRHFGWIVVDSERSGGIAPVKSASRQLTVNARPEKLGAKGP
jgi:hypothetical protein